MKIIESDVSGVWGPEIKAVASQAKAAHRHTHTQRKMRTPCRASKAAAWLIKADWHPSWPPGAEPVGLGLSLGHPQESSLTLGHKHPSAPVHPLPYPTTTGGKISWKTVACEWNIRSLYQHQQWTHATARTMLLLHICSEEKKSGGGEALKVLRCG